MPDATVHARSLPSKCDRKLGLQPVSRPAALEGYRAARQGLLWGRQRGLQSSPYGSPVMGVWTRNSSSFLSS